MICLCHAGCSFCMPFPLANAEQKQDVVGFVIRHTNGKMVGWSDEFGEYYVSAESADIFKTQAKAIHALGNAISWLTDLAGDAGELNRGGQEMFEFLMGCKVVKLVAS